MGVAVAALAIIFAAGVELASSGASSAGTLAGNPDLDPGTSLSGRAPDFTLTDQFGRRVSLRTFRGQVVILAFNDSECTTICPLTTTAMLEAKAMLGSAASRVALLGIDANPTATAIADVRRYSELHGMVHRWHFLTGSLSQLKSVWKAYKIEVAIERQQIDHTPALFMIDTHGHLARLYLTQQSYAAVEQLAQLLAQQAARLLPGHPDVRSRLSYAQIPGLAPTATASVPTTQGRPLPLGPGKSPRLYLFFATWDREVTDLSGQLEALNSYQRAAVASGLPALTAIDEASVEPSVRALRAFIAKLPHPPSYAIGVDRTGRVADGYSVQDEPWLVLVSSRGKILWDRDVATAGWLSRIALERQVRNALARAPHGPPSATAAESELTDSPPPLAAVHAQAGRALAGGPALAARIRMLRGYPIVLNAWASWCDPCRAEYGLLASASARYGRRVAFLGADVNDDTEEARAFLAQHPVSYPSYQMSTQELSGIVPGGLLGTPTTIFIGRTGKVLDVHTGEYVSQGTLDADIQTYALRG